MFFVVVFILMFLSVSVALPSRAVGGDVYECQYSYHRTSLLSFCVLVSKAGSSTSGAGTGTGGSSSGGPGSAGRSYGIGGAFLHKQIQLMTRQSSVDAADKDQDRERDKEKGRQGEQKESEEPRTPQTGGTGEETGTDTQITPLRSVSPPPTPRRPLRPESPLRKRLSSPFRMLRERSGSRERSTTVVQVVRCEARTPQAQPEQDSSSGSGSGFGGCYGPRAFTWLCRDRHKRRKTL